MKSRTDIRRFLVGWTTVLTLLVCFIALIVYEGNSFISIGNMVNIPRATTINTVFGIAATITVAPNGSDMSVGTLANCSVYVSAFTYLWLGQSLGMSIFICILAILVMYQLTMFLTLVREILDMLATCVLIFVHQGIGQWYVGGGAVSIDVKTSWGMTPACTALLELPSATGRAPWIIIIILGCVLVTYFFLNFTKHGRYLYAVDGNKEAVRLFGIDMKKYRYLAGMTTAVFIAIGGILVASRGSSAQVICHDNYLMPSLAAVFAGYTVGGTKRPNALGIMIGAMLVSTLENGLAICAVPFYVLPAVKGSVLALALITAYTSRKED